MNLEQLQTAILDTIVQRDDLVVEARKQFIESAEAEHVKAQ